MRRTMIGLYFHECNERLPDGHMTTAFCADGFNTVRRTPTHVRHLLTSKLAVISSRAEAAGVTLRVEVADDIWTPKRSRGR
jgi:hypothetical protein